MLKPRNVSHYTTLGRGWDGKTCQPKWQGYYRGIKGRPGAWYVLIGSDWHAISAGPTGETPDDLSHQEYANVYVTSGG